MLGSNLERDTGCPSLGFYDLPQFATTAALSAVIPHIALK